MSIRVLLDGIADRLRDGRIHRDLGNGFSIHSSGVLHGQTWEFLGNVVLVFGAIGVVVFIRRNAVVVVLLRGRRGSGWRLGCGIGFAVAVGGRRCGIGWLHRFQRVQDDREIVVVDLALQELLDLGGEVVVAGDRCRGQRQRRRDQPPAPRRTTDCGSPGAAAMRSPRHPGRRAPAPSRCSWICTSASIAIMPLVTRRSPRLDGRLALLLASSSR